MWRRGERDSTTGLVVRHCAQCQRRLTELGGRIALLTVLSHEEVRLPEGNWTPDGCTMGDRAAGPAAGYAGGSRRHPVSRPEGWGAAGRVSRKRRLEGMIFGRNPGEEAFYFRTCQHTR